MNDKEYWYRYKDQKEAYGVDCDGDLMGPFFTKIRLLKYPVVKHTPKGVRLDVCGRPRTVLHHSRNKFACETKEEAIKSFIARKKRQITILSSKLSNAERAIELAERIAFKDEEVPHGVDPIIVVKHPDN